MMKRKFKGARYVTRGINGSVTYELQLLLWDLIDQLDVEQDYLQVFKLEDKRGEVKLTHRQEEPDYRKDYILKAKEFSIETDNKIFVIDDGEYATMMFASEY
ncbi:MAG TPA: DUF960 family protein [Proteiniclasticum sp.]|nr:DUF960 family protein [Proteiniclasticum sp.]